MPSIDGDGAFEAVIELNRQLSGRHTRGQRLALFAAIAGGLFAALCTAEFLWATAVAMGMGFVVGMLVTLLAGRLLLVAVLAAQQRRQLQRISQQFDVAVAELSQWLEPTGND